MSTHLATPTATAAVPALGETAPPARVPDSRRSHSAFLVSRCSEDLAAAAGAGDVDAAGELYRRVRGRARRAARTFCAESDADDAVAEGLSTALRRICQLRDPAAVEAWMVRCVVRCAIDISRRRRRPPITDPLEAIGECRLPTDASAADAALLAIERDSMAAVVRTLHPRARLLLYLRYDAGLSIQHIAAALGKPQGTIRRQCLEARRLAAARFLSGHLRPTVGVCAGITAQLCREPHRRAGARVRRRTTEHLLRCGACRDREAELGSVLAELGHRPHAPIGHRP